MIKSRSAFNMPSNRPRRIVERDPIAGLGLLGKEYDPFLETRQSSTPRTARDKDSRNPILGQGNLGQEVNLFSRSEGYKSSRKSRNPLEQPENGNSEADRLRPRGRPGKASIHQAQRDPISGRGEFGREWDPVHKYAGRPRPWHQRAVDDSRYYKLSERPTVSKTDKKYILGYYAKRGGRCNPLTGEDAKSFDINQELRRTPRKGVKKSNPVTGENCDSYTVSDKLNEKHAKSGSKTPRGGNPVTGENCKSFDFNIESKSKSAGSSPRKSGSGGNPAKNPLTGANCPSFSVNQEERPRTAPSALATPRASSNPVTGEGCRHYVVCTGEKKLSASPQTPREAGGNPLTGSNVRCFDINQEMRINRRGNESARPAENGHHQTNGVACDAAVMSDHRYKLLLKNSLALSLGDVRLLLLHQVLAEP
uniref:MBD domain-containing protein n=1 Tax=Macrostomum lignano TaxID=282301 RepID=A0A1I8HD70_9PLAT